MAMVSRTHGMLRWRETKRCIEPFGGVGVHHEPRQYFRSVLGTFDDTQTRRRKWHCTNSGIVCACIDWFRLRIDWTKVVLMSPMAKRERRP